MKIIFVLASLAFAFVCDRADAAPMHICSSDAVARAKDLLIFYRHPDETGFAGQWSVDESAVKIGSVRAIHGKQRFDVLEVWGHIYKGNYRMRLIYAQIGGKCLLMGEEIFEDAAL